MKPVTTDGGIYVAIAFCGAIASALGSDDAAKYISPATLWYVKNIFTACGAGLLALKMYRSTAFADYKASNGKGDTQFLAKKDLPPTPEQPKVNP